MKENGFSRFTGRTAWRYHESCIDVVNFRSFNAYDAGVMGCTTYSFEVNLGLYPLYVPEGGPYGPKIKDGQLVPMDSECAFRGSLHRSFSQPEHESRSVWYIDAEGRYVHKAVHDVRMVLSRKGFPWFRGLRDPKEVLRTLLEDETDMAGTWGFGNFESPRRHYLTGYVALALGRKDLAGKHLIRAAATPSYSGIADVLQRAVGSTA